MKIFMIDEVLAVYCSYLAKQEFGDFTMQICWLFSVPSDFYTLFLLHRSCSSSNELFTDFLLNEH